MRVLIYSTKLFEIFLILRRNNQDTTKMYIGLHIKYLSFWTDFNETWIFSKGFSKYTKVEFYENLTSRIRDFPCRQTKRRTDITELTVAFRNFANAPKN
jgi:hypothetical protein